MPVSPNPEPPSGTDRVRISARDLTIVVIAVVAGVVAQQLLVGGGMPFGQSVVAGAGAFGAVFCFLDRIVA